VDWHTRLSGVPGPYRTEPATLGFQKAHSAIIHQTIRCATVLSGAPAERRLSSTTVDCKKSADSATVKNSERQSQSVESEAHRTVNKTCSVWHRTVRCHMKTTTPTVDYSQTLMVGWRGGAPDSVRWRTGPSSAPIDSSHPQRPFGGWGL
jgi:hypothetical protein